MCKCRLAQNDRKVGVAETAAFGRKAWIAAIDAVYPICPSSLEPGMDQKNIAENPSARTDDGPSRGTFQPQGLTG